MPKGMYFKDKDGHRREEKRIKWWQDPAASTYKSISVIPKHDLPEIPINVEELRSLDYYREDEKKVFFGHYWLEGEPDLHRPNICCLDYSIAKNGKLVAYRLTEEHSLDAKNIFFV